MAFNFAFSEHGFASPNALLIFLPDTGNDTVQMLTEALHTIFKELRPHSVLLSSLISVGLVGYTIYSYLRWRKSRAQDNQPSNPRFYPTIFWGSLALTYGMLFPAGYWWIAGVPYIYAACFPLAYLIKSFCRLWMPGYFRVNFVATLLSQIVWGSFFSTILESIFSDILSEPLTWEYTLLLAFSASFYNAINGFRYIEISSPSRRHRRSHNTTGYEGYSTFAYSEGSSGGGGYDSGYSVGGSSGCDSGGDSGGEC